MNRLPDPSFYLQLSESFIKTARMVYDGDKPHLSALREISSAELASQPNPIVQIAGEDQEIPIPVAATLSLGETVYQLNAFEQIGFSTLTEFIGSEGRLREFELGVFQKKDGLPAPTASPTALDLVFCGFNSTAIPEISDAFPNLDAEPTSVTLAALDQFRFLKSQCQDNDQVLLIEIAVEVTHLFLIGKDGLIGIEVVGLGRNALYEAMAEVLHLHYIGSAIKLFTRSGFDSSELAPRLGDLFGAAIQSAIDAAGWEPCCSHITGLLHAQTWFQEAVLKSLNLTSFQVSRELLPFSVDDSIGELSPMDTEILAKVYTSLVSDEDFSWHNDYLGSLRRSDSIPRREAVGSNPPFPTAHPDRMPDLAPAFEESPAQSVEEEEVVPPEQSPYAPPQSTTSLPQVAQEKTAVPREPKAPRSMEAIPEHLLSDIEEYEGEFEEDDDFGGGTTRVVLKFGLLVVCIAIVAVLVTVVFFPKASEKYLGIRPPHIDFDDADSSRLDGQFSGNPDDYASTVEVTDADVASGLQDLRDQRENQAFGGLFMQTSPNGATVVVGDLEPMQSPIKLPNVTPGTYDIIISMEGYETRSLQVTIEPKQVHRAGTIVLKRLP